MMYKIGAVHQRIRNGDDAWTYDLRTTLTVHGKPTPFDHHGTNRLKRVAKGKPNPLKQILDWRTKTG